MAAWHQLQQQQHTAERKKLKQKEKFTKWKSEWMVRWLLAKCMKGGNYYLKQIFVQTKKSEWKIIIIK